MLRVSLEAFTAEVQKDLPRLIRGFPTGIRFADLQDEYGESPNRIKHVLSALEKRHIVSIRKSSSNTYYILPTDYVVQIPFPDLTELQRRFMVYAMSICAKYHTNQIRSNYTELSRILVCSFGGLKSTLLRLVKLGHIRIASPTQRGHQDALILEILHAGEPIQSSDIHFDH